MLVLKGLCFILYMEDIHRDKLMYYGAMFLYPTSKLFNMSPCPRTALSYQRRCSYSQEYQLYEQNIMIENNDILGKSILGTNYKVI